MPGADAPISTLARAGLRWCGQAVVTLLCWSVWLALALLLALQVYIACTKEVALPAFVQRALERRLAASAVHIAFRRARFDPSGRVMVEDVRLKLPGFEEALVSARSVYVQLDPWALLVDRFEPVALVVTGVSLRIPAMLSPSGKADEIVRDLDAELFRHGAEIEISYLGCRLGPMAVALHGTIDLSTLQSRRPEAMPAADFLARDYAALSREGAAVIASLAGLDHPRLSARLSPSPDHVALVDANFAADGFLLGAPFPCRVRSVRLRGRLPLSGAWDQPARVAVELGEIDLPRWSGRARGVRGWLETGLVATPAGLRAAKSIAFQASAEAFSAGGVELGSPLLTGRLADWKPGGRRLRAAAGGRLWSQPVTAQADLDLDGRSGSLEFAGPVGPAAVAFISGRLHRDLRRWVDPSGPIWIRARADLASGWKFARARGSLAARDLVASHVHLDEIRGRFEFDGRHLVAPEAYTRLGEDSARGRFEEDVTTRDYRFLLEGRLRPLHITPWIAGKWWPEFFGHFDFSRAPVAANFDMTGCWRSGQKSVVFVAVDCVEPVVRGVAFDRARARLFIRPQFVDGLALRAERGSAAVRGKFSRRIDFESGVWRRLDFDLVSGLDLATARQMMGPTVASDVLDLFAVERPPQVSITAGLDGPAAPDGTHQSLHIESASQGEFRYGDFPLDGAAFTADVRDGEVTVEGIKAGFAGGTVTGRAHLTGRGADRRLQFQAALRDASLGPAVATVNAYTARREHRPPPPPGEFIRERSNVRLDADLAAEGRVEEHLGYHGEGTVTLKGAEVGEIRTLGLLSALLRFTSLRFTAARSNVTLDGSQLIFPNLSITGANSAIDAKGTYGLDDHRLDFRATVNPFRESKSLPQRFMDVMLTPLAEALAVRLVGTIEKPSWVFVNGPANFLRNRAPASQAPSPLKSP